MSYYGELCTRMYESDKSLAEGKELEFYLSFVHRKDMRVLEPMCGNGRLLIPFMQQGIDIEGFDISDDMLKVCREKGKQLNLEPRVYNRGIEDFISPNTFDLIVIPFGSFSLLPEELVNMSLHNLKKALTDQGKLLVTIMLKDKEVHELPEWTESGKVHFEHESIVLYKKTQYLRDRSILFTELKYQLQNDDQIIKTEMMEFPLKLYSITEFEGILQDNDFEHIRLHEVKDGYGQGTCFHVFECS
ncbi:class I SAM-dependent methyltransferase [Paenibacillus sp. JJ-223]|uniref:class I SAM-dependent methyltransferase n=1 Tax=Paenibacillus sp. JJ-223 TaxID=2905647 RepID=UPI001F1FF574|nr:class I SAM-dependent methyltransferase [Paenibacillus sp. JJ-223]CAH1211407.1 hypothetical protein PAECIP111890_03725 [Paenibacillus sp. JJ-223]